MIQLTRLNGKCFVLNSDLIKFIESTPDTTITLTNGEKLMVSESVESVLHASIIFRQLVAQSLSSCSALKLEKN